MIQFWFLRNRKQSLTRINNNRHKILPLCLLFSTILLLFFIWNTVEAATSWSIGFYLSGTDCLKCNGSCFTCTDANSWDTCTESMFKNTTTNLCQFCPDTEYYDNTAEKCQPWNGKCIEKWAYQQFCFDCQVGEFFNLDTMVWVQSCGLDSIGITDPQLWNKPVWRPFAYYVDTLSTDFLELGTNKHPYKNLELAFVEILNFHSHSNSTLTVFVKELTENMVGLNLNYVLNISKVEVWSYSNSNQNSPGNADIYIIETSLFSSKNNK